jgi:hypothetical protein
MSHLVCPLCSLFHVIALILLVWRALLILFAGLTASSAALNVGFISSGVVSTKSCAYNYTL